MTEAEKLIAEAEKLFKAGKKEEACDLIRDKMRAAVNHKEPFFHRREWLVWCGKRGNPVVKYLLWDWKGGNK